MMNGDGAGAVHPRPSEAGGTQAPDAAEGWIQPEKYKVKRCKYCRTCSIVKSPLCEDCFPSWWPLMPWADGRRDSPKGLICKLCNIVSLIEMGLFSVTLLLWHE